MLKTRNCIRGGVVRPGYVQPESGIHAGLAFEYEPMLSEQVLELDLQLERLGAQHRGRDQALVLAEAVAKQLRSWSEVDDKDNPVPISLASVRTLPHPLLKRLHLILAGVLASDPLPDASSEDLDQRLVELRAEAEGYAPGQTAVGASQGN